MDRLMKLISYIFLVCLAVLWISPVLLVVMNSTKTLLDFSNGSIWALPSSFHFFENISDALKMGDLGIGIVNSLAYGIIGASLSIFLAALAAYGIVILKIKGGFYWFLLIYSGTIFPFQMYLVPLFKAYQKLGFYDTFWGMCLFYIVIAIPFCVFLLRNYMTTISYEMVEAAQLDGFTTFGIFSNIILPLLLPPISVLFLFQFTWIWNDLIFGMTLTRSQDIRPVMAGISAMQGIFFRSGLTTLMAGIVITSLPTLLLFFALQRNFIKGMQLTTVKS